MKPEYDFSEATRKGRPGAFEDPAAPIIALWMLHRKETDADENVSWHSVARIA